MWIYNLPWYAHQAPKHAQKCVKKCDNLHVQTNCTFLPFNCLYSIKKFACSHVTIIPMVVTDLIIKLKLHIKKSILILKHIHSTWKSKRFSSQSSLQAFNGYVCSWKQICLKNEWENNDYDMF